MKNTNLTICKSTKLLVIIPQYQSHHQTEYRAQLYCSMIKERVESNHRHTLPQHQPIAEYFKTLLFELVELCKLKNQHDKVG